MKKRIYCIIISLCIVFAAGCNKAAKTDAAADNSIGSGRTDEYCPEVRREH